MNGRKDRVLFTDVQGSTQTNKTQIGNLKLGFIYHFNRGGGKRHFWKNKWLLRKINRALGGWRGDSFVTVSVEAVSYLGASFSSLVRGVSLLWL